MNAKPNVPDYQHALNRTRAEVLRKEGYKIEVTSQGYRVEFQGKFIAAAGTLKPPHGRYREANLRDNLACAFSRIDRHAIA